MARTYESTHPWLTFELNTTRFDHLVWMALGEAASKCSHVAGVPLAPEIAKQMHRLYLMKGAVATTAIEGNTLSEEEAVKIIDGTLKLPPSQQYLADELNNIVNAVNTLTQRLAVNLGNSTITVDLLKEMNHFVLSGLELDEDVVPGKIRSHSVVVGRYRCAPAEDCEYLLERLCETLNDFPAPEGLKQQFCIIKAIFAHLYFVWIHPFGDGNGRTARLLELYILLSAGFAQPTGHLLSNHYNRTRPRYYQRLDSAVRGEGDVINFIKYTIEGLVDGLREQINFIREQQWEVAWVNYVHTVFHSNNSPTDVRRRHIVIALSRYPAGIGHSQIAALTPELMREFHGKTPKTVMRDLNALLELDLIVRLPKGLVRAKREKILAFLPWSTEPIPSAPPLGA